MSSAVAWISEGNPGPRVGDWTGRQEVTLAGRGRGTRLPNPLLSSPAAPETMTSWQLELMGMGGTSTLGPGARTAQGSSSFGLTGVLWALAVVHQRARLGVLRDHSRNEGQGAFWLPLLGHPFSPQQSICPLSHLCTAPLFPASVSLLLLSLPRLLSLVAVQSLSRV